MSSPTTKDVMSSPKTKDEKISPTTKAEKSSPTTKDEMSSPTTKDEMSSPTTKGEICSPTKKDEMSSPTTKGEKSSPTKKGEISSPPTKDVKCSRTTKDEISSSTTKDEISSPTTSTEIDTSGSPPKKRNKISPPESRAFKKIPIIVVEGHNEVLNFIYNCFTSRHLPLEGNTLVHFDSHPDMVVPSDIDTSSMYTKDYLPDLSIENWIMPGCFVGHFNKVIWVKNSWCDQITTGTHEFLVGQTEGRIAVTLEEDYFISEGSCSVEEWLDDPREMTLQVIDADREVEKIEVKKSDCVILDIDLDFFSTADPFVDLYEKADCYNKLKEIFYYSDKDYLPEDASVMRRKQLDYLRDLFDYLEEHRRLEGLNDSKVPDEVVGQVKELIDSLSKFYKDEEIDYCLIYNAGCTCDHGGLPNHISTEEELQKYFKNFEDFLRKLPCPPKIVTIARSSEDGYCPKDQVDRIQKDVISILKKVYLDTIADEPIIALNGETNWDIIRM